MWIELLIQHVTDDHFSSEGAGRVSSMNGRDRLRREGHDASPLESHLHFGDDAERGVGLAEVVSVGWVQ